MLDRRSFLKLVTAAVAVCPVSSYGEEEVDFEEDDEEDLVFDGTGITHSHVHRRSLHPQAISYPLWMRRGDDVFRMDISTIDGYRTARWALRDIEANRIGYPDPELLKMLSRAQVALAKLSLHSRFDATSGMRVVQTNQRTEGAALNSCHLPDAQMRFKAVDFRARGFDASFTAKLMGMVGMGGIGFYFKRDFVHADTGRTRRWSGA